MLWLQKQKNQCCQVHPDKESVEHADTYLVEIVFVDEVGSPDNGQKDDKCQCRFLVAGDVIEVEGFFKDGQCREVFYGWRVISLREQPNAASCPDRCGTAVG